MSNFLTSIHINKIFHLEDFDIPVDEIEKKHLILTGKEWKWKNFFAYCVGGVFSRYTK